MKGEYFDHKCLNYNIITIYGTKEVFLLCLMIYLILKVAMKEEKGSFLLLFFDRPYLN